MASVTFTANIGNYHGLKFSQDGKPRLSFSAAETARVKDQSGQYVDGGTTWFSVTLFGYTAEALDAAIAAQGGKGKVIVTGRMSTRQYEKDGVSRESLDVVAESVGLVPKNQPAQSATSGGNTQNQGGWGGNQAPTGNNSPSGWGSGPSGADTSPPF